ncbi:MAG: hypothetical protein JXQ76_05425, partial [Campylobacterales bacterium]|nr:hypothetical protein [Campylobacterales bacterium]
ISNKDLISAVVEVSNNIPDEDVHDTIELKTYEELGLDQANEYIISSIETAEVDNNRSFHVFVIEPETIQERYAQMLVDTKYIDLLIPSPLLFMQLYQNKILHNVGVDCFVYFTRFDTVVVLYQDGGYLYSKSIEHSLTRIYEKYLELPGDKVQEEEFYQILGSEGLKTSNSDYQKDVMKIFGEVFIGINDILIYAKRAFDLGNIDKIYIGSEFGPISGLEEYSQTYLGHVLSELNFDYEFNTDEWYLDQLQCLMILSSYDFIDNEESKVVNLTQFHRPPPFHMRPGGQFIITTSLVSIVGISYPSAYLIGAYANKAESYILSDEEKQLTQTADKYKQILAQKTKEIEGLDKELEALEKKYESKIKTLSAIYDKKVNYKLKSESFYRFAADLKSHDVRTDSITSSDDTYEISLVSESSKSITKLIKHISDKYFEKISEIDIAQIHKDEASGYYKGTLKVKLR